MFCFVFQEKVKVCTFIMHYICQVWLYVQMCVLVFIVANCISSCFLGQNISSSCFYREISITQVGLELFHYIAQGVLEFGQSSCVCLKSSVDKHGPPSWLFICILVFYLKCWRWKSSWEGEAPVRGPHSGQPASTSGSSVVCLTHKLWKPGLFLASWGMGCEGLTREGLDTFSSIDSRARSLPLCTGRDVKLPYIFQGYFAF